MRAIQSRLEAMGHTVLMPIKVDGVDYWADDNQGRVEAKRKLSLVGKHMEKIEKSDAILVVNITKGDVEHYIGANTFLEIGFAHYRQKRIYLLNGIPEQKYILDEMQSVQPMVLHGKLEKII